MKTRERLLFMALGGLLVLAGMIVGQFVFSTAQAQDGAQDATFKTVRCEELLVGGSSGVAIQTVEGGTGAVVTMNNQGSIATILGSSDDGFGLIAYRNKESGKLEILSEILSSGKSNLLSRAKSTAKSDQPSLFDYQSFSLYSKKGTFTKTDLVSGEVIKQEKSSGFQKGELKFVATSEGKGLILGNQGSAEVSITKNENSITFVETTSVGNKHILIIYDDWNEDDGGFYFVYTRNIVDDFLLMATLRSVYKGVAKPDK